MNALFVHDHKFKVKSNTYYTSGSLSSKLWNRYLRAFKTLTVVGRDGGLVDEDSKYSVSSFKNVNFELLPDTFNLKDVFFGNSYVKNECKKLVASHDAVIARLPSRLGSIFIKEAILQKKPYAIEVVGSAWDALWNYGNLKGKVYAPILELNTRNLAYNAPFALYVTEHYLQKKYPCSNGQTTFCSNAEIDAVNIEVLNKRFLKINSKDFQREKIIFGLIGNYSANYKGIDVAIKALAQIHQGWILQIVGAGDPSKYIELAKELNVIDSVQFIGRLPSGESIYNWLDTVDIYLQPSLVEGLPRALVEAMSRGCPSLGSTAGGIPELLSKDEISKTGSDDQLKINISRFICNIPIMQKAAKRNFEYSKKYYKNELTLRREKFWTSFSHYANEIVSEQLK